MHSSPIFTIIAALAALASARPATGDHYTSTTSTEAAHPSSTSYSGDSGSSGAGDDSDLPPIVPVNTRANDADLIHKLTTAATARERYDLLDQPGDFVFDFMNAVEGSETEGKGGRTVASTATTFPALIGNSASMSVGFLGPCGLNTPHVHPRGTELNIIVRGRLVTNFIPENGVDAVENTMSTFQMAVFPQGAVHTEFNPDCEDAVFVAGFPSEDPGVEQVAETFFGLRSDIVQATLGGVDMIDGADLESFRDMIPGNVAAGVESCLKKCGIEKNEKRSLK
ncbi:hypothetical protein MKZ38_002722 [Zalerion maritima]|uniref:Cupin type-1 domain-containing protein n=1 Tax=Zalerion maritima TaxID=339359 RepID=A0AAD5RNJ6_9PEZI|nr:hypothetical protein MKZ38_002722 [Zalerion maritima]